MRKADLNGLTADRLNLDQLNDQVYELLRVEILAGNLTSGQSLTATALASRLGISPTPVRDALRRLSTDGRVEVIPRRGTFVAEFTRQKVKEVFQIRCIVECAAVETLAETREDALQQIAEIVHSIDALREGEIFPEYAEFISLDQELHRRIVGLLGNEQLNEFYERLRWPEYVVRGLSQSSYQRAGGTLAEHAAILKALQERDVAQAKTAILTHLNNAEADLLRRMPLKN
ncbi:MAG: GntR family transcriptional regulator [Anaerolineae bacterium]|nr:GntR family transcriptional regulator [Anaerolineae bacterium]